MHKNFSLELFIDFLKRAGIEKLNFRGLELKWSKKVDEPKLSRHI
jgi:hypothetical protein